MDKKDRGPRLIRPPGASCPIPVGKDTDISQIAETCLETVAQDQYTGDELRFLGKTRLEAAVLSLAEDSAHDPGARTEFLDRVMGKPRQRVDSTNVNVTLTGFLERLAEEESAAPLVVESLPGPASEEVEAMFK